MAAAHVLEFLEPPKLLESLELLESLGALDYLGILDCLEKTPFSLDVNQVSLKNQTFFWKYLEVAKKVFTFAPAFENETQMKHSWAT